MSDVRFAELDTEAEWRAAYPVLTDLWADTDRTFTRDSFVSFLRELSVQEDYRLFGLFDDGALVATAGAAIRLNAWYGRYLWVYDLVTDPAYRSAGYGGRLMSHLEEWAAARDCETLALASGVDRTAAHRFYEEFGLTHSSHVFTKPLAD